LAHCADRRSLTVIGGQQDQLVSHIHERYGAAKDEAERQAKTWVNRIRCPQGTIHVILRCDSKFSRRARMGRAALLWFLGVPIPVLLLMWALGWLH
jgi:hypothetical protein